MKTARNNRPKGTPDDDEPLTGRMVALTSKSPRPDPRRFDVGVRRWAGRPWCCRARRCSWATADDRRHGARPVALCRSHHDRTSPEATLWRWRNMPTVPVINGLTNRTHPCQIMADVMTYEEHRGPIAGSRWSGLGTATCLCVIPACGRSVWVRLYLYWAGNRLIRSRFVEFARERGSQVHHRRDPALAVRRGRSVVTDTWVFHARPGKRQGVGGTISCVAIR